MLIHVRESAFRSTFNLIRELILILAVGALGGQLLIVLNGGAPIGSEALAATTTGRHQTHRIASLEIDLNPSNPGTVRSVLLRLSTSGDTAPEQIFIQTASNNHPLFACHLETPNTWHCPTPGLKVGELEQVALAVP